MTSEQSKPYPLRLPSELRAWLRTQAARNSRSVNQEIAHRLAASREQQEPAITGSEKGEGQNGGNRLAFGDESPNLVKS